MIKWFYIGSVLLILFGILQMFNVQRDKSRQENESYRLNNQIDSLKKIIDVLQQNWKS